MFIIYIMESPVYLFTQIKWLPIIVLWLVYIAAAVSYYSSAAPKLFNFKFLAVTTIALRFLYAAVLSVLQYYVWSQSEITKLLINSPLSEEVPLSDFLRGIFGSIFDSKLGYFLFYSWGHFWINVLLSILVAFAFYGFLKALKKHNDRFFHEGETELGLLLALIVGWPNFVVFIPLVFLAVVLVSIFRGMYLKEMYTTLGVPMLLAALITMIFGSNLIIVLGLTVLKI